MKFAKLFEIDGRQIVVLKKDNEDGDPVLEFHFVPDIEGLGICTSELAMKGRKAQMKAFDSVNESNAFRYVNAAIADLKESFSGLVN